MRIKPINLAIGFGLSGGCALKCNLSTFGWHIAENQLSRTVCGGVAPDALDLQDCAIELAGRMVWQIWIVDTKVKGGFATISCDQQHVVITRVHHAGLQRLGPLD